MKLFLHPFTYTTTSLILGFLFAQAALASPALFGGEFTFTHPDLLKADTETLVTGDARVNFMEKAESRFYEYCKTVKCIVSVANNSYGSPEIRLDFEDGWNFKVNTDPRVIEVQTKPETLATIQSRKVQIQSAIFDNLKFIGLTPHKTIGGGHHNIGFLSGFDANLEIVANFITDHANHPGLERRIFTDPISAPALDLLPRDAKANYASLVQDVFAHRIKTPKQFSERLNTEVYAFGILSPYQRSQKYQAVSVMSFEEEPKAAERVEVRNFAPQKSAEDFALQCELLQARIEYVTQMTNEGKVLPLEIPSAGMPTRRNSQLFYYITDAGLDFEKFRGIFGLPPESQIIKDREFAYAKPGACSWLLRTFQKTLQTLYLFKNRD